MGRLYWRERWSTLGCRRGWIRLAGLIAPALLGYFALYGWLRWTGQITTHMATQSASRTGPACVEEFSMWWEGDRDTIYIVWAESKRPNYTQGTRIGLLSIKYEKWPWIMKALWPAARLEFALSRRGWLPKWWRPKGDGSSHTLRPNHSCGENQCVPVFWGG